MFPKKPRIVDRALLDAVKKLPCCVCGSFFMVDPSHIKTVGSNGPDLPWNVFPKCRKHHTEWGQGWSRFIAKYPHFMFKLKNAGWTWETGKLWHDGLKELL